MIRKIKYAKWIAAVLSCTICVTLMGDSIGAVTLKDIQNEKKETQQQKKDAENQLSMVQEDIENISDEKEALEEELAQLDDLLFDMILEVNLIKSDIEEKHAAIDTAQAELIEMIEQVNAQQEAMNKRIKYMYEKGNRSYMEILLESKNMAEAVNKMEYTEKLYSYDRVMLEKYQLLRQDVAAKELQMQIELSELEEVEEDLEVQEAQLNALIEEKQATIENFSEQLSNAKSKAASYEKQIKEQSDKLKQINAQEQMQMLAEAKKKAEEEAKKKAEEAAKKKLADDEANKKLADELKNAMSAIDKTGQTTEPVAGTDETAAPAPTPTPEPQKSNVTASGSGIGADIANYGLQFVGNPYVAGGTSLTNGCDCSGFTQSVYAHFGISLPRSSYSQSEGGVAVDYANIQAGDIIYYGGHVAIYIGNNQIVHASTAATGIKVSNALYRSIITIRRYY